MNNEEQTNDFLILDTLQAGLLAHMAYQKAMLHLDKLQRNNSLVKMGLAQANFNPNNELAKNITNKSGAFKMTSELYEDERNRKLESLKIETKVSSNLKKLIALTKTYTY